jgi:pantoate--beta-alanine ligase
MEIFRTVAELRQWSRRERNDGGNTIGLAPTMGALHAGHASLIRAAKASTGSVAVSIFINPAQFGPNEDYARYPRTFEADCALAQAEGADVVFAPTVEEMYPAGAVTFVEVEGLSHRLDGKSRWSPSCSSPPSPTAPSSARKTPPRLPFFAAWPPTCASRLRL